jgi:nucleotide-binding universal stress UspA family protein
MIKHILIPMDGSRLSERAAKAGVALARSLGARVTAFVAVPPPTPIVYKDFLPVKYLAPDEHAELIENAALKYLGVIERAAKAAGVRCQSVHATSDFPADAILATARKRHCDLIVMASHGRRGLKAVLLGSQTQKVLARAGIPVLVFR